MAQGVPPLKIFQAAVSLRNRLLRLIGRMVPPEVNIFEHAWGMWRTQMVATAARLRLADLLAGGPKTLAELAAEAGAHPESLERLLRALRSWGFFEQRKDGRYALNRAAEPLRTGVAGSMRDLAIFAGSKSMVLAWAHLEEAVRTGQSGYQAAFGGSYWDGLRNDPEASKVFDGAMLAVTSLDVPVIASGFDFSRHATVCDVAGGVGTLLAGILERYPKLTGAVFDAPAVEGRARDFMRQRGLETRAQVIAGDFFEAVPVGFDVYLLRNILHDWDDQGAARILAVVRRAMKPGAVLLISEMVLVEGASDPFVGKMLDLNMMALLGGKERSPAQFGRLLGEGGFRLVKVHPMASPNSLVEAAAA